MKVENSRITSIDDNLGRFVLNCFVVNPALHSACPLGTPVEVCLTVNGVEVDVEDVVNQWMQVCENNLTALAVKLIEDRMDPIQESLQELTELVNSEFNSRMAKIKWEVEKLSDTGVMPSSQGKPQPPQPCATM